MTASIVVVGAGGFGREALDVLSAINRSSTETVFAIVGVVDANPSEINMGRLRARGIRYLGTEKEWLSLGRTDTKFVIGIGDPRTRLDIAGRWASAGYSAATLVHPSAGIGDETIVGPGSVVCAGVQISTNVSMGTHVHVNANATIGHDSVLEDFVSLNPGAIVSGDVRVRRCSLVGAGAVVLQGLDVGAFATVGAAACVVHDVAGDSIVKGVPAR
jgi:sugar O-acyltransferase (sialic acid O-acetyltransferase NeuD family)